MSNKYRVQVRQTAVDHAGQFGWATYSGKAHDGEDVFRVVFGEPGFEHSAKFRGSDLGFETRWGWANRSDHPDF